MNEKPACACGTAPKLIFACSGSSDVGAIADQAARKLTKDGAGKMYCLAGIGGRVSVIMESTKSAAKILVIDGCPLDCAGNTLRQAGFNEFEHLRLCEIGMAKGQSEVCDVSIQKVVEKGRAILEGWGGTSV
ncbi:MAG: putative zinc-binding protein [Kiritimatiellae bacterium]|nr:putative zinc-binding protein [Kiritimatiellia bacterium]